MSHWTSRDPATGEDLPVFCYDAGEENCRIPEGAFEGPGWPILERSARKWEARKVAVITPIAPLHRRYRARFERVIREAWEYSPGPFDELAVEIFEDKEMRGPGWGRNQAMDRQLDADWYLFVDADDLLKQHAFEAMNWLNEPYDSVWGMVERRRRISGVEGVQMMHTPRSFRDLPWHDWLLRGFYGGGTQALGMFVRGDFCRKFRWLEKMNLYEDLEYFVMLRAHGTATKLPFPIVTVDELSVSTDKPHDTERNGPLWRTITKFWREHGRQPLDPEVLAFRNEIRTPGGFYGR